MNYWKTAIPDVLVIQPDIFGDSRGYFFESYRLDAYSSIGLDAQFVQDNQSLSRMGVLRGIHYQIRHAQGKLVRVTQGSVLDVAVDLRKSSATLGCWVCQELSDENHLQLWIPPGFGHAFLVMSATACFQYKTTDYYAPEWERTIRWNDPTLNIEWPQLDSPFIISNKDQNGSAFNVAELYS